jgi:hypothetical protein
MPEFDAVLALSCETDNMQSVLDIVWDKLLPAFNTSSADIEKKINGKVLKVNENPAGISSLSINFYPDRLSLGFQTKNGLEQFEAGRFDWVEGKTRFPWGAFSFISVASMAKDARKVSSTFLWRGENELEIRMIYHNCPHRELLNIRIEGNTLKLSWPGNPAAISIGRAELNLDSIINF